MRAATGSRSGGGSDGSPVRQRRGAAGNHAQRFFKSGDARVRAEQGQFANFRRGHILGLGVESVRCRRVPIVKHHRLAIGGQLHVDFHRKARAHGCVDRDERVLLAGRR